MSQILKIIKDDLKIYMLKEVDLRLHGDTSSSKFVTASTYKTVARSIISMFPSLGIKPENATDEDVIKLIKKYINNTKESLLYVDKHITSKDVVGLSPVKIKQLVKKQLIELNDKLDCLEIKIAQSYLPTQASKEEIIIWIKENIDFTSFKNKMHAMKPIMIQFKGCNGNLIKNIIDNLN